MIKRLTFQISWKPECMQESSYTGEFIYTVKAKFVIKPKSVDRESSSQQTINWTEIKSNFVKNNKILMFVEAMNLY